MGFGVFGAGALIIGLAVLPLVHAIPGDRERRVQRIIHQTFRLWVWFATALRLFRVQWNGVERLCAYPPCIVVANHPTLIDIVLLISRMPQADCVVKRAAWRNPFLRWIVRPAGYIPETAIVYPGTVYVEGTKISEGRGTTRPFEINGAPYADSFELAKHLNELDLPGVYFRPHSFQPTFQKHAKQLCHGVQIHVLERNIFKPVITGIALIKAVRDLYPGGFAWQDPPYEYVYDRCPFDVIAGTNRLREQIEGGAEVAEIAASWGADEAKFVEVRRPYLLY